MPAPFRFLLLPLLLCCLLRPGLVFPAELPAAGASAAEIQNRIRLWSSPALDSNLQKLVLPLAEEAARRLQQAEQAGQQAADFRNRTKSLPGKAEALRSGEDTVIPVPENLRPPPSGASVDILEVAASRLHAAVEDARREVTATRDLPQQNAARRRELSTVMSDATARLLQFRADSPVPLPGDAPEYTEAKSLARNATLAATEAQLDAAQAELAWLDASDAVNWPALQLDVVTRRLASLDDTQTRLRDRIEEERRNTAAAGLETAARNEASAPAGLQPVLGRVTLRAAENRKVVDTLIPEAESRLRTTEMDTRRWLDLSLRSREKINLLRATGIVGMELRQQRQSLPTPAEFARNTIWRQEELTQAELSRLSLEEELAALPPTPPAETPEGSAAKAERESILTLQQSYSRYQSVLIRLEEACQQYRAVVSSHREFIHENILWIPSTMPAGRESLSSFATSLKWLGNGLSDPALLTAWWQGFRSAPFLSLVSAGLLAFLFVVRRFARHRLDALARLAGQPDPGFRPTFAAVVWTCAITLPWPAVVWFLALPWLDAPLSTQFALTWAVALQQTAFILLGMELLRQPLRPHGLAEAHFEWPGDVVKQLRWQFRRILAVIIPAALLGSAFGHSNEIRHDPAERFCLVLLLLASAWWLSRFWVFSRNQSGLPARGTNRMLWYAGYSLCILLPLSLAGLALRGYLYTAEILTGRLAVTIFAAAGFLLIRTLFLRWYTLHRRQLRAARARKLREARDASRAAAQTAAAAAPRENLPAGTGTSEIPPEPAASLITGPDIDENGQEMRGLVDLIVFIAMAATAWAIWADVLPAARTLAERPLTTLTASSVSPPSSAVLNPVTSVTSSPASADAAADSPAQAPRRTTWLGVLMAGAVLCLTMMAAKRIPGTLQFVLTSQISLDSGARFALITITRYLIVILGMVLTLNLVGITWESVHWLAAALTVGLGFGLQEIFANFFSGLIILFERPIRPGDIVTIDNITGSVARIQIRATTIRGADGKDYIVPNKEFVTGKLLNWTRTDTATRQEIPVGIAYGSDPAAALRLLAKVAADHPAVLKDPAPLITFDAFGDSSLNLRLRFHVGTVEQRLSTLTDLHCAIAREFAAAGIEIPFPQRDIHLRSVAPGVMPPLPPRSPDSP